MSARNPEQIMWAAVIYRAVIDAQEDNGDTEARQEARDWILKPNRDFNLVCEYAGKDPHRIRAAFLARLAHPTQGAVKVQHSRKSFTAQALTYNGTTKTIAAWSEETGISRSQINRRLKLNWPVHRALNEPYVKARGGKPSPVISHNGITMTLPQWSKHLGIKLNTLHVRLAKGWTPAEAFTRPVVKGMHLRANRHPGEGSNFRQGTGTGGGSTAHDFHELEISPQKEPAK